MDLEIPTITPPKPVKPEPATERSVANLLDKPVVRYRHTPEFNAWFSGSKIVDDRGEPLVVYHGTHSDFTKFHRRAGDVGMHFGTIDQANDRISFMGGRQLGAGAALMPVFLCIKRPFRMEDMGLWNPDNMNWALKEMFPDFAREVRGLNSSGAIREFIQARGYDGVVYRNTGEVGGSEPLRAQIAEARRKMATVFGDKCSFSVHEQQHPAYIEWSRAQNAYQEFRKQNGKDSYIAFEPTQVKSAIGNRGSYARKDSDIRN